MHDEEKVTCSFVAEVVGQDALRAQRSAALDPLAGARGSDGRTRSVTLTCIGPWTRSLALGARMECHFVAYSAQMSGYCTTWKPSNIGWLR